MPESKRIVVALGGNAITQPHEIGKVSEQFANSRHTATQLADMVEQGHQLVVTHGNGPQIGNFLLRNEAAATAIHALPMEVAVAHVQGGMGFMIAQALTNELARRGIQRTAAAIVTTVLCDSNDPSFKTPSKPIGRYLSPDQARYFVDEEGWNVKEISPGKYRRVVPSPTPQTIQEIELIRQSVDAGHLLVVCGGGGIPVVRKGNGDLHGTKAVIDKDLASSLLARELGADSFMILTNVQRVCLNFGSPGERKLDRMAVAEAKVHLEAGEFGAGSMGPKVRGALEFVDASAKPDAVAMIGHLEHAAAVTAGENGTWIVK